MVFRNQDLAIRCALCCRGVAAPRASQLTELGRGSVCVCMCVCVHAHLHVYLFLYLSLYMYRTISSLKTTEFISSSFHSIFAVPFSSSEKTAFIILHVCTYLISPPVCNQYPFPTAKPSLDAIPLLRFWYPIHMDALREGIFSSNFVDEKTEIKWCV